MTPQTTLPVASLSSSCQQPVPALASSSPQAQAPSQPKRPRLEPWPPNTKRVERAGKVPRFGLLALQPLDCTQLHHFLPVILAWLAGGARHLQHAGQLLTAHYPRSSLTSSFTAGWGLGWARWTVEASVPAGGGFGRGLAWARPTHQKPGEMCFGRGLDGLSALNLVTGARHTRKLRSRGL